MKYDIVQEGSYPVLEVTLQPGEKVVSEAGAMTWMTSNIQVSTGSRGGVMAGLKRSMLGGESLFQNEFYTESGTGTVGLAPGQPGTIVSHEMTGDLMMQRGAYLASGPNVTLDSKWGGLKGLFGQGLFVLKASGQGPLFFTGYGDVTEVQVDGEYIVDSGFAVAWEGSLEYQITTVRSVRAFLFSDTLLMHFTGHGRLWAQSRSPNSLASWAFPFRPVQKEQKSSSSDD